MKELLLTSGILILVLTAVRQLLKNKVSRRLQYALWLLVALRLLVPVQFCSFRFSASTMLKQNESVNTVITQTVREPVSGPSYAQIYDQVSGEYSHRGLDVNAPQIQEAVREETAKRIKVPTVGEVLTFAWLTGMGGMALWFLWINLRFSRKIRQNSQPVYVPNCPVPVKVCPQADSPCLMGLLRPVICLTPVCAQDSEMLKHVLAHEQTHLRHLDHIWSLVRCLCLCIHWYNPLVWIAAVLSRRDCELACDEGALKTLGEDERLDYGRTLVDMVARKPSAAHLLETATAMNESKQQLKERVTIIVKKPKFYLTATIALVLAAAIAAGCTFSGPADDPGTPDSTQPTSPTATTSTKPSPSAATRPAPTSPAVTEPTEPIATHEPTEPYEMPQNPTVSDLVFTLAEANYKWADQTETEYNVHFSVPAFYPFCDAVYSCNDVIEAYYMNELDHLQKAYAGKYAYSYDSTRYEAYLNGNVLSVIIVQQTYYEWSYYRVFNFDIETGQALSTADMVTRFTDLTYAQFLCAKDPSISFDTTGLLFDCSRSLYLGRDGQLHIAVECTPYQLNETYFAQNSFAGESADWLIYSDTESYKMLFDLESRVDGAYATGYGIQMAHLFVSAPKAFIQALAKEDDTQAQMILDLVTYEIYGYYSPESIETIIRQLENNDSLSSREKKILRLFPLIKEGPIDYSTPDPPADDALVRVADYLPQIRQSLAYATTDNFTGQVIYDFTDAYLRYGTLMKLGEVCWVLEQQGLGLLIWDGFRPISAQEKLWEICPDPTYVSHPVTGGRSHCRGSAVDVTLIDLTTGELLPMPTGFDDFSAYADRDYSDCSPEAAENARLLEDLMEQYGFTPYFAEWWHFSDTDSYPVDETFDPASV